ncbi:MAG: alpha/beta fold hydrolase [Alphaproteobacteria bacterium]|nr:alpha/beta fold hydrolase [Alphaproteobacteria bacterium]
MWIAMILAACTGSTAPAPVEEPAVAAPSPAPVAEVEPPAPSVKHTETLQTRDGIELEADIWLGEPGANGVVLLHMIPPHWDRTSWPTSFVEMLSKQGWSLCVVDRRGSGKSGGAPTDAYQGEKGKYDVEACVKRLQAHGLGKLGIVGASNGTTSMLDYAVWAPGEGLPEPAVLGFMTGGPYTENQTGVVLVEHIPAVFTFSQAEREWSGGLKGVSPKWTFHEYLTGDHGTKMFDVRPDVAHDLLRGLTKGFGR